ncbi:hypothetical protein [Litoreibacter ponti]|nr:hypothetical protein [Litoreibacter ponti]
MALSFAGGIEHQTPNEGHATLAMDVLESIGNLPNHRVRNTGRDS